MLFNSTEFIFFFLPITLLVFHALGRLGSSRVSISWLVLCSLFFYGWWNPAYLGLILGSMLFNYAVGVAIDARGDLRKALMVTGVAVNLGLLGYFKYANFFMDNLNTLMGGGVTYEQILLPLAISFFTFQQISYLVDAYKGEVREYRFLHYALFVTFFPQLIAGPIVHHREMMPQFAGKVFRGLTNKYLVLGLSIFAIGLFKKVIFADGIAVYVTPVFEAAEAGVVLTFFEAWGAALSYMLQIYFDFSGYSDMAIGLALMFGIRLPLNFYSPYKAVSIIDFWRCWHMTLSRFLRDYVYIPLGGNRRGEVRRLGNIFITVMLGGVWHGAGWTFIIWGALHAVFLVLNHLWRKVVQSSDSRVRSVLGWALTMLVVCIAWVPFRAETLDGALSMWGAMAGHNGFALFETYQNYLNHLGGLGDILLAQGWEFRYTHYFWGKPQIVDLLILMFVAIGLPNTTQIMRRYRPAYEFYQNKPKRPFFAMWTSWLEWRPTAMWALFIVALFLFAVLNPSSKSEFLYFQF